MSISKLVHVQPIQDLNNINIPGEIRIIQDRSSAKSDALVTELIELIENWPYLLRDIRDAILSILRASNLFINRDHERLKK